MATVFYPSSASRTKAEIIEAINARIADGSFEELGGQTAIENLLTDELMQQFIDEWHDEGQKVFDEINSTEAVLECQEDLMFKLAEKICR